MRSSFTSQWLAALMAVSLATLPAIASPQVQVPPPPPEQTAQPAQPPAPAPQAVTAPQQAAPDVKAGSKQDVNAIGNRDVGKGLDFYSIPSPSRSLTPT